MSDQSSRDRTYIVEAENGAKVVTGPLTSPPSMTDQGRASADQAITVNVHHPIAQGATAYDDGSITVTLGNGGYAGTVTLFFDDFAAADAFASSLRFAADNARPVRAEGAA